MRVFEFTDVHSVHAHDCEPVKCHINVARMRCGLRIRNLNIVNTNFLPLGRKKKYLVNAVLVAHPGSSHPMQTNDITRCTRS